MTEILRRHAFSIAFICVLIVFAFLSAPGEDDIHRFSGYTMGTTYQVQVVGVDSEDKLQEIATGISALLSRLDKEVFSTYAPDSELSLFNQHPANQPFPASADLIAVLQLAAEVSEQSAGAFDVTIGPLVNLWGFGPDFATRERVPDEAAIMDAMAQVGYHYLDIDVTKGEISKSRAVYVDLSAIAKGYAVDRVGDYLVSLGVKSYFLEVGGELKMAGLKPGGASWIPAIERPEAGESQLYEVFFSRGDTLAVAGSGDYRNYFEVDGIRYSHEIDPRTGRPITHRLAAAYVLDESAARADALATAFMVMGLEASQDLAEELQLGVYFISKNDAAGFSEYYSPEFAVYLSE